MVQLTVHGRWEPPLTLPGASELLASLPAGAGKRAVIAAWRSAPAEARELSGGQAELWRKVWARYENESASLPA